MTADAILALNIRVLLAKQGIEQRTLAAAVGHSEAWISKALHRRRGIQINDLDAIADVLGVTVSALFRSPLPPTAESRPPATVRRTRRRVRRSRPA